MEFVFLASTSFAQGTSNNATSIENTAPGVFCYTNPVKRDTAISMRDHFIIEVDDKWYCTGTSLPVWAGTNPGVRLLVSDDLINREMNS